LFFASDNIHNTSTIKSEKAFFFIQARCSQSKTVVSWLQLPKNRFKSLLVLSVLGPVLHPGFFS